MVQSYNNVKQTQVVVVQSDLFLLQVLLLISSQLVELSQVLLLVYLLFLLLQWLLESREPDGERV